MVVGWAPWWTGQTERTSFLTQGAPLRRQYRLPVQERGPVSVSLSLIPPEDEDEEDWQDVM